MIQRVRRLLLTALGILIAIFPGLAWALPNRTWASATITTIPTMRWVNISEQWGGSNVTDTGPNLGLLLQQAVFTYSDSMGQIVFVIFFAIPFIMMWIVQSDMTMPAIIGMLFSLYIFAKLPEQYILFSVGCFVICIAALLWSLYKRAY